MNDAKAHTYASRLVSIVLKLPFSISDSDIDIEVYIPKTLRVTKVNANDQ